VIDRIVVGIDGSGASAAAVRWAAEAATALHVPVLAVHAANLVERYQARPTSEVGFEEELRQRAEREWCGPLQDLDVTYEVVVRAAPAVDVLLDLATGDALVVVGRRGAGLSNAELLGSTSRQLVSEAEGAVVVVGDRSGDTGEGAREMTSDQIALAFLAVWVVHAIVLGLVMHRRGYNGFGWAVVAGALGPLATMLAVIRAVPESADLRVRAGAPGPGAVDLLAGIDGSPASIAGAREAIELLGRRLGRLSLAIVEPQDGTSEHDGTGRAHLDAAVAALTPTLQALGVSPDAVVLHGRPAVALVDHAGQHGYDVVAIGARGRGLSRAVLGSVANALMATSTIPVLVGALGASRQGAGRVTSDSGPTLVY
jgi:nucleotide-binding universal stress UspA family protein